MRLLAAVYTSGQEFLSRYSDEYPAGAVFCATRAQLALGERVLLEVRFPELPNPAVVRGRVVSSVDGRGAWIECDRGDSSISEFIVSAARGAIDARDSLVRHHARFPARVAVKYRISELDEGSVAIVGETADLGSGGAYVRVLDPPKVGTRVRVRLVATERGPIEVEGRVAWARPGEGFGVRFDQQGPASAAPLRPLIRRIRETGELPLWASATTKRADTTERLR